MLLDKLVIFPGFLSTHLSCNQRRWVIIFLRLTPSVRVHRDPKDNVYLYEWCIKTTAK